MRVDGNIASFVFSGKMREPVKSSHAAAGSGELLLRGKSVLIITVADIMSAMKDTFSNPGNQRNGCLARSR